MLRVYTLAETLQNCSYLNCHPQVPPHNLLPPLGWHIFTFHHPCSCILYTAHSPILCMGVVGYLRNALWCDQSVLRPNRIISKPNYVYILAEAALWTSSQTTKTSLNQFKEPHLPKHLDLLPHSKFCSLAHLFFPSSDSVGPLDCCKLDYNHPWLASRSEAEARQIP